LLANTQNYANQIIKFLRKITVISVQDNSSEFWLFVREFVIAAMLNQSLKVVLSKRRVGLVELKGLATRKEKPFQK